MDNKLKKIILITGDILVLYFSLYLTLALRYFKLPDETIWASHFQPFTFIFIIWLVVFFIFDLYNLNILPNKGRLMMQATRSLFLAGLLSSVFFYINPEVGIAPKTNLIIYLIVFYTLFILWRKIYSSLLYSYLPKNNIAIIGINDQAKELLDILKKSPHLGYSIKLIIDNEGFDITEGIGVNLKVNDLKKTISDKKITSIILVSDPHQSQDLRTNLFSCLPLKINIISLPNFYESVTGKVPIEAINQMWFLENLSKGNLLYFNIFKRSFDIVFGLTILLATLPFWPLIALCIKIESRGPVFFRQERRGKDNKFFSIIKFRTMLVENNDHTPTISNDKRVTKFGSFLRKTRIDEIPQIINVLAGDMSFVGPRPERPELISQLEKNVPFYKERMLVKPGLTGCDQISGEYHSPSQEDTLKKLQYDLFYIKNRSIYLDLAIILKTIATILSRSGV